MPFFYAEELLGRSGVGIPADQNSQQNKYNLNIDPQASIRNNLIVSLIYHDLFLFCKSIYVILLFVMIKFNSGSAKGRSTDTSNKFNTPINRIGKENTVTPFVWDDKSVSPAFKKVDKSPLQVPLAIAIKQLTGQEWQQKLSRPKSSADSYWERPYSAHELEFSKIGRQIDEGQLTNLKNILQQFMESLYYELEKELQGRFSSEMKRIIIKHRQTERMLKTLQHKLTINADVIASEKHLRVIQERHQREIKQLGTTLSNLKKQLEEGQRQNQNYRAEVEMLKAENRRVEANIQKYENVLINKLKLNHHQPKQFEVHQIVPQIRFDLSHNSYGSKKLPINTNYPPFTVYQETKSPETSLSASQLVNVNQIRPSYSPVSKKAPISQRVMLQGRKKHPSFCDLIKRQPKS